MHTCLSTPPPGPGSALQRHVFGTRLVHIHVWDKMSGISGTPAVCARRAAPPTGQGTDAPLHYVWCGVLYSCAAVCLFYLSFLASLEE